MATVKVEKEGRILTQDPDSIIHGKVAKFVDELANFALARVVEKTPVGATAVLSRSIAISSVTDYEKQVGTSTPYGICVEYGTKPHFPPVEPLALWARRKLGVPEENAHSVGYLIARKISRVGTKGVGMFKAGAEATEVAAQRSAPRLADEIISALEGR